MNDAAQGEDVMQACVTAMERVGFEKKSRAATFLTPLGAEVFGWASHMVNHGQDGAVEITPKVGVRHEELHKLVDRLSGSPRNGGVATISVVLGYLMPQNSANVVWRFDRDTPTESQANDLAAAVIEFGRPYMLAHLSLEAIIDTLRSDTWYGPKRIPAALVLLGRDDEAREYLASELAKRDERTDPRDVEAAEYRLFAERLSAELG